MACDFNTDMGAIDRRLLDAAAARAGGATGKGRASSTPAAAGCSARPVTISRPRRRRSVRCPPSPGWCRSSQRVLASTEVDGIVIHPAMVSRGRSGVFDRFARAAAAGEAVPVVGSEAVRWPLVHAQDLADLYALALERAPRARAISVRRSKAFRSAASRAPSHGASGPRHEAPRIISTDAIAAELGEWARGYALDQRLSGAKARRELGWAPRHLDPEAEIAGHWLNAEGATSFASR